MQKVGGVVSAAPLISFEYRNFFWLGKNTDILQQSVFLGHTAHIQDVVLKQ
jgi:hypothetical protein